MQSYTIYKVSEFHKDRHPYIEPPKTPLYDPQQVSIAYNERAIPKLSDLLVNKSLPKPKLRDALHTLNELVSNQETKSLMIEHFIVSSASTLTVDHNWEVRREACMLLGSLLFLDTGRRQFAANESNYKFLQNIIFDNNIYVRLAVGWTVYRLSLHNDGLDMLNESSTIFSIVNAFNEYSKPESFYLNHYYLIYLLSAMGNVSMYDVGITNMLGRGLLRTFNKILEDSDCEFSGKIKKGMYLQIRELVLNNIKNIVLVDPGKEEAIEENLILTIYRFLNSELEYERLYSSAFMMGIANSLVAKKQISQFVLNKKFDILEVRAFT